MRRFVFWMGLLAIAVEIFGFQPVTAQQADEQTVDFEFSGIVTQSGYGDYSVRIWNEGQIMHIDYPELNCGGTVALLRQTESIIELDENLDRGTDSCGTGGFITMTQAEERQWIYKWSAGENSRSTAEGSVELTLAESEAAPPNPPDPIESLIATPKTDIEPLSVPASDDADQSNAEPIGDGALSVSNQLAKNIYLGRFDQAYGRDRFDERVRMTMQMRALVLLYAHERTYLETCLQSISESISAFESSLDLVTTRGGVEVDRSLGEPETVRYRQRFAEPFLRANAHLSSPVRMIAAMGLDYINAAVRLEGDARHIVAQTGCGTKMSEQFSYNLAAFVTQRQSLQSQGLVDRPFSAGCRMVLPQLVDSNSEKACDCIQEVFEAHSEYDVLEDLENDFSYERFVLSLAHTPGLFEEARQCR